MCTCEEGWSGVGCTEAICEPPCVNGRCEQPGKCLCDIGYSGPTCSEGMQQQLFIRIIIYCFSQEEDWELVVWLL